MEHTILQALIPSDILNEVECLFAQNVMFHGPNTTVNELLSKSIRSGGKRFRPMLMLLVGDLLGVERNKLHSYARLIEFIHTGTLIHDDVIDQAELRRGTATLRQETSNKFAVLAGDYLLADVFLSLSKQGPLSVIEELSIALQSLVDGELLQLNSSEGKNINEEFLEEIARKKTASLMIFCSVVPGIIGGLNASQIDSLRNYGHHLGIAFQLGDDILDVVGVKGKDSSQDEKNDVLNAVKLATQVNPDCLHSKERALIYVKNKMRDHVEEALLSLQNLTSVISSERSSRALEVITTLTRYLVERDH